MIKYASVAVPVPLNEEFLYSFDDEKFNVIPGVRVMVFFKERRIKAYVVNVFDVKPDVPFSIKPILRVIDSEPLFSESDYKLALWMEKFYFSHRGEVLDTMIPGGKKDVSYGGLDSDSEISEKEVVLTEEQKNAVDTVLNGKQGLYYLFGITGSGKTEVFLNCAQRVIEQGGQVIYLVPEITLTHQLAKQVLKRFKNNVAILHSAMTDSQRITQWRKIKRGEVNLIIGARSAVFAPCTNLRLIIIDEEHENSYKSGNDPRYHARQVAQKRIQDCNGKLLMGSATPSLESWNLMKDPKKMVRIDLTKRVGGGSIPKIEIVDMKDQKGMFSLELQEKMNNVLAKGKQVILFLNRRGFSYYFHCNSCGYEHKCPHCDVSMTYHKRTDELVCHYCGHREKQIKVCPKCGSLDVLYSGFGTEQVEHEVNRLFPMYKCARLDTDVVSQDRTVIQKTLDEFKEGKVNILIGTQMVAKGLNFPNVQLVGIIMADSGLLVPDFRAEERTFDLLVQVSGRSGRADGNGEVVIQTRMKENPAISFASQQKVEEFFNQELEIRKETGFPPFTRMINVVFRSKDRNKASESAKTVAQYLLKIQDGFEVFGSQECPIEKIRENYRYQVILKSITTPKMMAALSNALKNSFLPNSVYVEVDTDPLELL